MSALAAAPQPQEKLVVKSVRISVIGEQGCGKSTFVDQFVTGQGRLSKSAITFELERTVISRVIKRESMAPPLPGLAAPPPSRPEILTKYDVHVHDACASPVTNYLALENASCADFVIICFSIHGDNIGVLFQIVLDLFKVCHATSRPRPPFMLVGLEKSWEIRPIGKLSAQKDSKSPPAKQTENLCTIISRILDMFQCKLNFVVLNEDPESDSSTRANSANPNSANFLPHPCGTAVEIFGHAIDEYEMVRDNVRASVCDPSFHRIYYSAQHHRLACALKKECIKDANVETYIFPGFVGISIPSLNLSETPQKLFDVTELQFLDVSDNPLTKLNDGLSTLPMLSMLNASNAKLSREPSVLVACTSLTDLNLSRNCLSNASCLLKCASLIRLDISENVGPVTIDASVADFKLSSLTCLDISKTTCVSFDFIGLLASITQLNLRETGIREGSLSFLSQLRNLRHVDISHNKLTEIMIPVYLEVALVDNNELKSFEISFFNSGPHNLTKLSLNNNRLTELPKQIWHVSSLQDLSFERNSVSMLDFSFAFCGNRLLKFECEGNPFNLMPPAISDLLGNNKFSEACDMSIKSLPVSKIAVLSKTNSQTFNSIVTQLSRVSMIVGIQEKGLRKSFWNKTLLVANLNPPRVYFLEPNPSVSLEAHLKDKPFWDIGNFIFKFSPESSGTRQFLATMSLGTKSSAGAAAGKLDLLHASKTVDFYSASNLHQWDQYFKAIFKNQPKTDRQNILFKSMPGFICKPSVSSNFKDCHDADSLSPIISPMFYAASPRIDSMPAPDLDVTKPFVPLTDSTHSSSQLSVAASSSTALSEIASSLPVLQKAGNIASIMQQQVCCRCNYMFLSAQNQDMKYFLPFLANSDVVVINMADDSFTQSEFSAILSGIKFVSRQCPKHVFAVLEPAQSESIMDAQGKSSEHVFQVIRHHHSGNDDFIDQIHETLKSISYQRVMEPFVEYFQSFIMTVIKSRPPWTDSNNMMIPFCDLVGSIVSRRNSFDTLGKCCLSFLEDAAYDLQQYMLQICEVLDNCGVLVCWKSHISEPIIICNIDLFIQEVMIPLLYTAQQHKQVVTESRLQATSFKRVILTPQDRSQIWSIALSMTPSLMTDLDWALVSLHVLAVAIEVPPPITTDGVLLMPQPFQELSSDRPQSASSSVTQKKEGWIHYEDSASRALKKHWFTCSVGPDGVSSLTWRSSEIADVSSSTQSILFGKSTKTTVSQTKRNRQGWTHCCRIDHEDSRVSAKKIISTKIVLCFNNEKEMREWWSFIEMVIVPRAAQVSSIQEGIIMACPVDPQAFNAMLLFEDDRSSKESRSLTSIFADIHFVNSFECDAASSVVETVELAQPVSAPWLAFIVRIDAASEFILRSTMYSMSLYMSSSAIFYPDGSVKAIFKRTAAVISSDPVAISRSSSIAVLSVNERPSLSEFTVISAGHECQVLADILLEALVGSTRNSIAHCTLCAIENVTDIAENYGFSDRSFIQYAPTIFPSKSFSSLIHRPILPNLRRIIHIHSKPLTESSESIQEWAISNNWEYLKYTCGRNDCILATETAASCERLVLILEVPILFYRGRSRLRSDHLNHSNAVVDSISSLTEGILLSDVFDGVKLAKESICVVPWQMPSDVPAFSNVVVVPHPSQTVATCIQTEKGADKCSDASSVKVDSGESNEFISSLKTFMIQQ